MIINITTAQFQAMTALLARRGTDLMLSGVCRQYLAKTRWESRGRQLRVHGVASEGVMPGTVAHNRQETEQNIFGSNRRSQRLLGPLSAVDPVYEHAATLRVLSIGPRTEMELFHLMAIGFLPENISALDLISSSPLIETGDMHDLPYPDAAFDVVISSWVLNYSSAPQRAMDEMMRVAKHGALVAVGVTYAPGDHAGSKIVGSMPRFAVELGEMMVPHLDRVVFRDEPATDDTKGPVMLIARVRK